MHIRVRGLVELAEGVEHLPRLLRAGCGIEVRERLAVDLLLEDREVGAQSLRVKRGSSCHGHRAIVPRHRVMKFRATAAFLLVTIPLVAGCGSSGGNASSPGG